MLYGFNNLWHTLDKSWKSAPLVFLISLYCYEKELILTPHCLYWFYSRANIHSVNFLLSTYCIQDILLLAEENPTSSSAWIKILVQASRRTINLNLACCESSLFTGEGVVMGVGAESASRQGAEEPQQSRTLEGVRFSDTMPCTEALGWMWGRKGQMKAWWDSKHSAVAVLECGEGDIKRDS